MSKRIFSYHFGIKYASSIMFERLKSVDNISCADKLIKFLNRLVVKLIKKSTQQSKNQ